MLLYRETVFYMFTCFLTKHTGIHHKAYEHMNIYSAYSYDLIAFSRITMHLQLLFHDVCR